MVNSKITYNAKIHYAIKNSHDGLTKIIGIKPHAHNKKLNLKCSVNTNKN